LTPGDPNDPDYNLSQEFWNYMSKKHASSDHVLYEICNAPNGVNFIVIEKYANTIIPIIRANDPYTIIIIGTPFWSYDFVHIWPII